MIKKHQKRSIYATYQRNFLKQQLKKTFEPIKLSNLSNLLPLLRSSCSNDSDNCNICVNLWQRFLSLSIIYITVIRKDFHRKNKVTMGSFT